MHEPKLLVLDEPLGGLDPLSRHQFKDIVLKLAQKGTTVLFSSHILSDVQDVADRIGIINHGKIKQVGHAKRIEIAFVISKDVEVQLSYASDKWQEFGAIENVASVEQPSPGRVLVNLETVADEDQVGQRYRSKP